MLEVDRSELGRRAMEHYLGPENGFDRGFLNLITSEQIPLLRLFGSMSNEARALGMYREDERRRMQSDLLEMAELSKRSGDPAAAAREFFNGLLTAQSGSAVQCGGGFGPAPRRQDIPASPDVSRRFLSSARRIVVPPYFETFGKR